MSDHDRANTLSAAFDILNRLDRRVAAFDWGQATKPWGGAGVIISRTVPPPDTGNWGSQPRYVVTRWPRQLSWLFKELWQPPISNPIFLYDSKEEFFGRLAHAANRYLDRVTDQQKVSSPYSTFARHPPQRARSSNP